MTCREVQESVTEYALGILPDDERRRVSAHLLACAACREDADDIREIGDQLLDLVPDAEPGVGFDRAVLRRFTPRPRRRRVRRLVGGLSVAAAAVAAAVAIPLSLTPKHHRAHPAELTAALTETGRPVGTVEISGNPLWIYMTVRNDPRSGTVTCQVLKGDGSVVTVGSFQLVDGAGSWGASTAGSASQVAGVRLLSSNGAVAAQASFPAS